MEHSKIEYEKLTTGYEFPPSGFTLDSTVVEAYLKAVEDNNPLYAENRIVPPMAVVALAMAAMSQSLLLPPGTVHVSQELGFNRTVNIGETLTSYASVNRKVARGKFHMLSIGIKVENQKQETVITGETGFILPFDAAEQKK